MLSCVRGPGSGTPALDLRREAAYRTNNRGVALLEQQRPGPAAEEFQAALDAHPALRLAAINLPIAHYYAGDNREASDAAAAARTRYPDAPQPLYVLGLIAQEESRLPDALAAFSGVLMIDPEDVGARVHMARVQIQLGNFEAAVALCEEALAREPYNATAAYNLALALTRSGDRAAGAQQATRFQELTTAAYGVTYSRNYLEQGRYAEALSSTGLEADLVAAAPPDVTFAVAAGLTLQETANPGERPHGSVTLADLDEDGDLDLIVTGDAVQVFENDRMRFSDVTARSGIARDPAAATLASLVGDLDNNGTPDVLLLDAAGDLRLLSGDGNGRFERLPATTIPAGTPGAGSRTAALTDVDHDGDLDILIGSTPPGALWNGGGAGNRATTTARLLRNNRNGAFEDITADAGLAGVTDIVAIAPTDFDNRRDIDLLMVAHGAAPKLFRNLRTGSFTDVAATTGLPGADDYTSVALGDVNKDAVTDIFLGRQSRAGLLAVSRDRGAFAVQELPASTAGAMAAQLFDYDNDGLLDLLVGGASGLRLLRNAGQTWQEPAALAGVPAAGVAIGAIATGDLDQDGDMDVVVQTAGRAVHVLRNDGGNRNGSLHVTLHGLVSNRAGVGSKVELRAGSLYQRVETAATTPAVRPSSLLFGLGGRRGADVVRVLWPAGILQAETISPEAATRARISIEELDRKPSSCPYLFVWDGTRFVFVTDFLGGGEMGYWQAPGVRNVPDPVEYVRIPSDLLRPRDGRLELRVTNELEEALFLDELRLLAVTHPADTEVFPDEGMRAAERPFRMYAVRNIQPLARASDDHGHDVLAALSALDRRAPDDFMRLPVRGYAQEHGLVLDLPAMRPAESERVVLLLTGWTDYAFSRDNVAAHQAGYQLVPPALQQQAADGTWQTIDADVGIPVGRPQTIVVDVTRAAASARPLRLTTTMRIYWDQVRVGLATIHSATDMQVLPQASAALRWRGYSAPVSPDGREPFSYDYARVSADSPWKLMPGRYTREGDVGELLAGADDRHVISRTGDELAVAFDAAAQASLPDGSRRTYLLHATGYSKEMDMHSASPDHAAPVPFRAMSRYPYDPPEAYPHPADLDRFHTRVVPRPLPSIEQLADGRNRR